MPFKASDSSSRSKRTFCEICMNCKKKTLKGKRKHQSLTKIITKTEENTLKEAANLRNDTKMTTAVTDIDLIAKEFQKYEKCYREYTRIAICLWSWCWVSSKQT